MNVDARTAHPTNIFVTVTALIHDDSKRSRWNQQSSSAIYLCKSCNLISECQLLTAFSLCDEMSHPQPPQRQPTSDDTSQDASTLHKTALLIAVAGPILALLPPRRLNVSTVGLICCSVFSVNFLIHKRTGSSILQHVGVGSRPATMPAAAPMSTFSLSSANRNLQDTVQDYQRLQSNLNPSLDAKARTQREAWKVQQQKEIQEDIGEGKGFGDMIMDQIWEVWHWKKKGDDDD